MKVNTVLVDDSSANFRGALAALSPVKAVRFEGEAITSSFHTCAPVLSRGKLNLKATVACIRDFNPAVAIVDMRLEDDDPADFSGVALSRSIKDVCPDCCIILVSSYFESAPELTRYLEVFRYWVDRLQPAEQYAKELQKCYEAALKTHLGSVKYRRRAGLPHTTPQPGTQHKPRSRARNAVYISYAWGDEHEAKPGREEIVDRLDKSLLVDGYDVRRDKRSLPFKASISEFIKNLGKATCVVVVLSDKYLRSRYCMTELLELYSKQEEKNFRKRIFPIILSDTDIRSFTKRAEYTSYWKNELKQLEKAIRTLGPLPSEAGFSELRIYRDIVQRMEEVLGLIADMKSWTASSVEADSFAELKQSIDQRLREINV